MGVDKATFQSGGQISQHLLPGGYSRLDIVKNTGGLVSTSNSVLTGDCRGGEPNKILWFSGPTEAANTLRSGPLLDAIRHAFKPGGSLTPQYIGAWRVNPGTSAAAVFEEGANTMIDALAWDYGLHTNQLKKKLEAGTVSGKKLSIKFQNNDTEVVDNIEKESFQIQYTGAGTAVTMSITKTGLTSLVDAVGDLAIVFTSFPTIEDLVNYINDQADYTCTVVTGTPSDPTTELDVVTTQDIKTSAFTANSDLQAIIDVLNSSPWIRSAEYDTAQATRGIPDNDADWVYFSGAIDGAYTSTEWAASLLLAEEEDIQFMGCSSSDAAVHALIQAHCIKMGGVSGKGERQFIVGGAAGETVAQAITRAGNLNSEYGLLAYPGFTHYDFDNTSQTITFSPVHFAAKLLGMNAVLALPEPTTNKSVDVLEWEKQLSRTEAEELIAGGVCCGIKNRSGRYVVARSVTTYQGNELQKCEFSMMREALYVSRDMRTAIEESFIGKALTNSQLSKIDGIAIGKLSQYYDLGLFNGSPAYWGYKKTVLGDQVKVEYDCNLTPPTNFIFITSHMHVYASVA